MKKGGCRSLWDLWDLWDFVGRFLRVPLKIDSMGNS